MNKTLQSRMLLFPLNSWVPGTHDQVTVKRLELHPVTNGRQFKSRTPALNVFGLTTKKERNTDFSQFGRG